MKIPTIRFVAMILAMFGFTFLGAGNTDSLKRIIAKSYGAGKIVLLNDLASKYLDDNPELSIEYATEAKTLAKQYKNPKEEARAFYILADASYYLQNYDEAIRFYLASAEIEKQHEGPDSEGYINRIGDAGYCYYISDQHLKALAYYQESLERSLKNGLETQAASMYNNIGIIYTKWGDYDRALENNQKALEIDRRLGDPIQISTDLNNIGKIFEQWGRYDQAVNFYRESLEIARKAGNQSMIAIRLNNIAIVYRAWKRYPEALDFFQQALQIEHAQGNMEKVGRRFSNIAATYLLMKNYEKCISYLNQAAPLVENSGLDDDRARLYHLSGSYYLSIGNLKRAIADFSLSLEFAVKNNLKPLQMENLQKLSVAYEKSGEHTHALQTLKQFMVVKDSIFTAASNLKMAEFQARFDNEKMRLENDLIKKDAKLKQDIYLISSIGLIILIVLLLLIILILRLKARNARQARQMAEEQAHSVELELELRNKELTCNALSIIKKNETVTELMEALENAIRDGQPAEVVNAVFSKIRNGDRESGWKEFEVRFTQVHKDFYDKLNDRFPDLTPNERKLCAFLRLNMTTKDIASITHQSIHSINVARTRLRKKMNLDNSDENLVNYLINI